MRILLIIFLLIVKSSFSQIDDYNRRIKVLKKNIIGKEYVFGKWDKTKSSETHLTYLGKIETKKGRTLKIMTSVWIWGLSGRATTRILIFNEKNQYLGNYYVNYNDLPIEFTNGYLIFKNKEKTHRVNFNKGIPKMLPGLEDVYLFQS